VTNCCPSLLQKPHKRREHRLAVIFDQRQFTFERADEFVFTRMLMALA
jgi:hypothetical protein